MPKTLEELQEGFVRQVCRLRFFPDTCVVALGQIDDRQWARLSESEQKIRELSGEKNEILSKLKSNKSEVNPSIKDEVENQARVERLSNIQRRIIQQKYHNQKIEKQIEQTRKERDDCFSRRKGPPGDF